MAQVKEDATKYALAADTESRSENAISLRTTDDQEVGMLKFDYTDNTLIFQVTGEIPLSHIKDAEIRTRDGKIIPGDVSVEGKSRLVLLRKKKVLPKDVSQITLTMAE